MDALIEELNLKFQQWEPEITNQVRQCIQEIMELADQQVLDVMRSRSVPLGVSRTVEQQVLDLLDEP